MEKPYEEKENCGPRYRTVREKWEQNQQWMAIVRHWSWMSVASFRQAFQSKDILPDVRDPPEQGNEDVDMMDI